MNLENLPALVTGGGSGMGAVTAQMLSAAGLGSRYWTVTSMAPKKQLMK